MRRNRRKYIYLLFYCVILSIFLYGKEWSFNAELHVPTAVSNRINHGDKIMLFNQNTQRAEKLNSTMNLFYNVTNASAKRRHEKTTAEKGHYIVCKCNAYCNNTYTRKQVSSTIREASCERFKYDNRHIVRGPDHLGRLGNWLFQFGSTLGLAESLKHRPVIKSSNPILNYFDIKPQYISNIDLTNVLRIDDENWKNLTLRAKTKFSSHNLTMHGYFQSWKYFYNIADCVRELFVIKTPYINKARQFIQQKILPSKTLIGIHVRRGDMLSVGSKQIGRLAADKFYIEKAIRFYRKRCENSHFVVCSDDMRWSRENIHGSNVTFSTFKEPAVDLAILSLCDHVIITVGTFGWWGGWLSGGSVVYLSDYPQKGSYLDKWLPKSDYYPPNWIGMNNSA